MTYHNSDFKKPSKPKPSSKHLRRSAIKKKFKASNHKKIYADYFGYGEQSYMPCELGTGEPMVDVHHIQPRGRGGSNDKNYIANLIGVCRKCHDDCENGIIEKKDQTIAHLKFMLKHGTANR